MSADKMAFMAAMPPSMDAIEPHLYLGNISASLDYALMQYNNIKALVSLTDQPGTFWDFSGVRTLVPRQRHLCVHWSENATIDLVRRLPGICDFIDKHVQSGNALVHCDLGYSRAPAIIIGWLMRKYKIGAEQALARVNAKSRRRFILSENFMDQLRLWGELNYEPFEIGGGDVPKPAYDDWVLGRFIDVLGTSFKDEIQHF